MRNIRIDLQYDGTGYHGWQVQPDSVTIQGTLQATIKRITGEDVKVIGAGRTDAGVHALGQVAAFKTASSISHAVFKNALNALLPYDIRVMAACDEKEDFNPRFNAISKHYLYVISNSGIVSPFFFKYAWRLPQELDIEAMASALRFLEGTHDFSAFRASGCGAKNPERTITKVSIRKLCHLDFMTVRMEGRFIAISIQGDAFLRHMVRNIAGTVAEIGKGEMKPEDIKAILLSKDRKKAGPTAPAKGLFLEIVDY